MNTVVTIVIYNDEPCCNLPSTTQIHATSPALCAVHCVEITIEIINADELRIGSSLSPFLITGKPILLELVGSFSCVVQGAGGVKSVDSVRLKKLPL